jgi:hypothetical protein
MLQRIHAGALTLVVSGAGAGQILVDNVNAASLPNITGTTTLTANTGTGTITFQGSASSFRTLIATGASGITLDTNVSTTVGTATLTATTGNFTVADGVTLSTNNQAIALTATDLNLNNTGALNSGTATTTITEQGGNADIGVGSATGTFAMTISNAELQRITANALNIATGSGGGMIFINNVSDTDVASIAGTTTFTATAGTTGSVVFQSSPSSFKTLSVVTDGSVDVNSNLSTSVGTITFNVGNVAGSVNVADGATVSTNNSIINIITPDFNLNSTGALNSGTAATTITQQNLAGLGAIGMGDATGTMSIMCMLPMWLILAEPLALMLWLALMARLLSKGALHHLKH